MSAAGTFLPVADLPMIGCYQGVELSLDVGLAAMRSGTAAPDAWHFRLLLTQNRNRQLPQMRTLQSDVP